jgi:hypothetical protein
MQASGDSTWRAVTTLGYGSSMTNLKCGLMQVEKEMLAVSKRCDDHHKPGGANSRIALPRD